MQYVAAPRISAMPLGQASEVPGTGRGPPPHDARTMHATKVSLGDCRKKEAGPRRVATEQRQREDAAGPPPSRGSSRKGGMPLLSTCRTAVRRPRRTVPSPRLDRDEEPSRAHFSD